MKVLFFYPNDYLSIGIPNGIAVLSAILKKNGHQVDIFDTTFIKTIEKIKKEASTKKASFLPTPYTLEDLICSDPVQSIEEAFLVKLKEFKPDLIILSTMTGYFDKAIDILNKVRPGVKVIVGGVHSSICPEDAIRPDIIDFICVGEGEELILELCDCLESGKDYSNLKNLGYKKNGRIYINEPRPFINLDELSAPDWALFDRRHLFRPFMGKIYKGSFYVMSRGCPMGCTYCVNSSLKKKFKNCGSYFRFQSPTTTIKQLSELKELFGATWFKFADDSITYFSDDYLEELAAGLKKLNIQFGCSIRPEMATKNKIRLIKSMGCVAGTIGIESGNHQIRKEILNRHMTDEQIEKAVNNLLDQEIRVSTFNMIGLPEERREDVFKTIKLNKKLKVSAVNVYILYPYPGTPISEKYGINFRDKTGSMIPVSKASSFHLSRMSPLEVEGLLKTFDLYLKLPEKMWSVIEMAEGFSPEAEKLHQTLVDYLYKTQYAIKHEE